LFHADSQTDGDGWTDMTKLIVAFLNFTKAPKNLGYYVSFTYTFYRTQ